MDVHIGKCGFETAYKCGFCDATFAEIDHLEDHLRTCEVYECFECLMRRRSLSEMKTYIVQDHENCKKLTHMKINLENEKMSYSKVIQFQSFSVFSFVFLYRRSS